VVLVYTLPQLENLQQHWKWRYRSQTRSKGTSCQSEQSCC